MIKTYRAYSRMLGKSDDYLAVIKKNHKVIGNSKDVYEYYIKRMAHQNSVIDAMVSLNYNLTEDGYRYDFAKYIKDKEIVPCHNSFYALMERIYYRREKLIALKYLERWEAIVNAYKEFMKEVKNGNIWYFILYNRCSIILYVSSHA